MHVKFMVDKTQNEQDFHQAHRISPANYHSTNAQYLLTYHPAVRQSSQTEVLHRCIMIHKAETYKKKVHTRPSKET
jgi:hypothetical protein